jgi:hypothetical protein
VGIIGSATAACRAPALSAPRPVVRLTTGTPGAGFYPLGQALVRAYAQVLPSLDVQILVSAGSVANVETLQRGEADVGLSYADVAYIAFVGRLEGQPQAFDELRGIAVLDLNPFHLVVRANSGIRDAAGLRGRRIGVGLPGSGLGLAIVDRIARDDGGRLAIESEAGVGTTVSLTLPATGARHEEADPGR